MNRHVVRSVSAPAVPLPGRDDYGDVKKYLEEPPAALNCNPVVWWKENGHKFPRRARLARMALSAPPSSIDSERVFSQMKLDYSPLRNRLSGTKAGTLARVQSLMRHFGYENARQLLTEPVRNVIDVGGDYDFDDDELELDVADSDDDVVSQ